MDWVPVLTFAVAVMIITIVSLFYIGRLKGNLRGRENEIYNLNLAIRNKTIYEEELSREHTEEIERLRAEHDAAFAELRRKLEEEELKLDIFVRVFVKESVVAEVLRHYARGLDESCRINIELLQMRNEDTDPDKTTGRLAKLQAVINHRKDEFWRVVKLAQDVMGYPQGEVKSYKQFLPNEPQEEVKAAPTA